MGVHREASPRPLRRIEGGVGVKDVYSNRIVGHSIDPGMKSRIAVNALNNALASHGDVPSCVLHTDRGSQLRSRKREPVRRPYVEPVCEGVHASRLHRVNGDRWPASLARLIWPGLAKPMARQLPVVDAPLGRPRSLRDPSGRAPAAPAKRPRRPSSTRERWHHWPSSDTCVRDSSAENCANRRPDSSEGTCLSKPAEGGPPVELQR